MDIDYYNSVVPENISRIIAEKGLKQGFVAKNAGYNEQQMTAMLKGRRVIKVCDLIRIAAVLDVSVDDLCSTTNYVKDKDSA